MLSLPSRVRIFLARGPTDLRKAIDGLAALTCDVFEEDPIADTFSSSAIERAIA